MMRKIMVFGFYDGRLYINESRLCRRPRIVGVVIDESVRRSSRFYTVELMLHRYSFSGVRKIRMSERAERKASNNYRRYVDFLIANGSFKQMLTKN